MTKKIVLHETLDKCCQAAEALDAPGWRTGSRILSQESISSTATAPRDVDQDFDLRSVEAYTRIPASSMEN
jgi:hypothetical protein